MSQSEKNLAYLIQEVVQVTAQIIDATNTLKMVVQAIETIGQTIFGLIRAYLNLPKKLILSQRKSNH